MGFAYARLRSGERLPQGETVDFLKVSPTGQNVWTQVNEQGSPAVYEKTAVAGGASPAANGYAGSHAPSPPLVPPPGPFSFSQRGGAPFGGVGDAAMMM